MVRCLNQLPVDVVCFGNHEADVPYTSLVHRIDEFKGHWLNSNMPDLQPVLPSSWTKRLIGDKGQHSAREVAFMGFCVGGGKFQATYREGAFGGAAATMQPVLEAAQTLVYELTATNPNIDALLPLTHQDMAEDVAMAKMGFFPCDPRWA